MDKKIERILGHLSQGDREAIQNQFNTFKAAIERYDTIIERSPICTKIITLDRKLKFMSCAGHSALKIPDITQFYNKTYPPEGFCDELTSLYDEYFPRALKGESSSFECPIPDTEGHEEWYITHLIPIYKEGRELDFILASSANITERKNSEFRAEELHKSLLDVSRERAETRGSASKLHLTVD